MQVQEKVVQLVISTSIYYDLRKNAVILPFSGTSEDFLGEARFRGDDGGVRLLGDGGGSCSCSCSSSSRLRLTACLWNMARMPSLRSLTGSIKDGDSVPTLPTSFGT